ncbi:MAG: hypothetical protein PHY73_00005 [Candidatus Omnitrophica bacterium]|nr:hypothetical protein [Candidatus Omnitrophota bacterium]
MVCFLSMTIIPSQALAQGVFSIPIPGSVVPLSSGFVPVMLKGLKVYPDNPFKFDFIIDSGNSGLAGDELKSESEKLARYFLATLTTPEEDLWVNLSPYEEDRIIPDALGETEMGQELLAQDYILKQVTASLMLPDSETGKEFWAQVYKKAYEEYGTTNIPVDTFNKVWIVPENAVVYEDIDKAFVTESHLKVMLEEDFVAREKSKEDRREKDVPILTAGPQSKRNEFAQADLTSTESLRKSGAHSKTPTDDNKLASSVVREILIPLLEKEVNEGKNFAQLRQMFHAMVLATWYKQALKESILNKVYVDKRKVEGLNKENRREKIEDRKSKKTADSVERIADSKNEDLSAKPYTLNANNNSSDPDSLPTSNLQPLTSEVDYIYQQYLAAYKKGVCNILKVEYDPYAKKNIPRKYFSGGFGSPGGAAISSSIVKKSLKTLKTIALGFTVGAMVLVGVALTSLEAQAQILNDLTSINNSNKLNIKSESTAHIIDQIEKEVYLQLADYIKEHLNATGGKSALNIEWDIKTQGGMTTVNTTITSGSDSGDIPEYSTDGLLTTLPRNGYAIDGDNVTIYYPIMVEPTKTQEIALAPRIDVSRNDNQQEASQDKTDHKLSQEFEETLSRLQNDWLESVRALSEPERYAHFSAEERSELLRIAAYKHMPTAIENYHKIAHYDWAGYDFVMTLVQKHVGAAEWICIDPRIFNDIFTYEQRSAIYFAAAKSFKRLASRYLPVTLRYPDWAFEVIKESLEEYPNSKSRAEKVLINEDKLDVLTEYEKNELLYMAGQMNPGAAIQSLAIENYEWIDCPFVENAIENFGADSEVIRAMHKLDKFSSEEKNNLLSLSLQTSLNKTKLTLIRDWYPVLSLYLSDEYTEEEKENRLMLATDENSALLIRYFPLFTNYDWAAQKAYAAIQHNDVALYYALEDPSRLKALEMTKRNELLLGAAERVPECACYFKKRLLKLQDSPFNEAYFDALIEENLDSYLSVGLSEFANNVEDVTGVNSSFVIKLKNTDLMTSINKKIEIRDISEAQKTSIAVASIRLCEALGIPYTDVEYFERSLDVILDLHDTYLSEIVFGERDSKGREIHVINLLGKPNKRSPNIKFSVTEQEEFVLSTGVLRDNMQSFKDGTHSIKDVVSAIETSRGPLRIYFDTHGNKSGYEAWDMSYEMLAKALINRGNVEDVLIISNACLAKNIHLSLTSYLNQSENRTPFIRYSPANTDDLAFGSAYDLIENIQNHRKERNRMNKPLTVWDLFMVETQSLVLAQDPSAILSVSSQEFRDLIREHFSDVLSQEMLNDVFAKTKEVPDVSVELFDMFGGLTQGKKERELLALLFFLGLVPGMLKFKTEQEFLNRLQMEIVENAVVKGKVTGIKHKGNVTGLPTQTPEQKHLAWEVIKNSLNVGQELEVIVDNGEGKEPEIISLSATLPASLPADNPMAASAIGAGQKGSAQASSGLIKKAVKVVAAAVMIGLMSLATPVFGQGQATPQTSLAQQSVADTIKINDTLSYQINYEIIGGNLDGTSGTAPGEFDWPNDPIFGPDGNLYVVDQKNNRIQMLNNNTGQWEIIGGNPNGTSGTAPGEINWPKDPIFGPDGNLYVDDKKNNRIQMLNNNTGQWEIIGGNPNGTSGTAPGEFNLPYDPIFGPDGNLYVADMDNNRIQRITIEEIITQPNAPVVQPVLELTKPVVQSAKSPWPSQDVLKLPSVSLTQSKIAELHPSDIDNWRFNRITGDFTFDHIPQETRTLHIEYHYENGKMIPSASWGKDDPSIPKRNARGWLIEANLGDYSLDEKGRIVWHVDLDESSTVEKEIQQAFEQAEQDYDQAFGSLEQNNTDKARKHLIQTKDIIQKLLDKYPDDSSLKDIVSYKKFQTDLNVVLQQIDELIMTIRQNTEDQRRVENIMQSLEKAYDKKDIPTLDQTLKELQKNTQYKMIIENYGELIEKIKSDIKTLSAQAQTKSIDDIQLKSLSWKSIADNPANHHSERTYAKMKYALAQELAGNPQIGVIIDKATRLLDDTPYRNREEGKLERTAQAITRRLLAENRVTTPAQAGQSTQVDAAMISSGVQASSANRRSASDEVGGIDFNAKNLELKRTGSSPIQFNLPPEWQGVDLENIPGFVPMIINITPVTDFSGFLGFNEDKSAERKEVRS